MKQKFTYLPSQLIPRSTHYQFTAKYFERLWRDISDGKPAEDYPAYFVGLMKDVQGVTCRSEANQFHFTYSKQGQQPIYLGSVTLQEQKYAADAKDKLDKKMFDDVPSPITFSNKLIWLLLTQQITQVLPEFGALVEKEEQLRKTLREKEAQNKELADKIYTSMCWVLKVTEYGAAGLPVSPKEATEILEQFQMVLDGTKTEENSIAPSLFFNNFAWKTLKQQLKFYGISIGANMVLIPAFFGLIFKGSIELALLSSVIANGAIMASLFLLIVGGGVLLMFGAAYGLYRLGGGFQNPTGIGMAVNLLHLSKTIQQEALKNEDVPAFSAKKQSESSAKTNFISAIGHQISSVFHKWTQPSSSSNSSNTPSYEAK